MATATPVHPSTPTYEAGLIPVGVYDQMNGVTAVLGRDLHEFLEVKTAYKDWFPRMVSYGFTEGQDYVLKKELVLSTGRNRRYEQLNHIMTLDMAKEVAMIQRTERGKQARQYFIEIEKAYREQERRHPALPQNYVEALEALVASERSRAALEDYTEKLEDRVEVMEPKAEAYDAWIDGSGAYLVGTVAKILNPEGTNTIGQNRLFKFLRDEGVLIKSGNRKNMPVQSYIKHFAVKTKLIKNFDGSTRVQATTFVRPSGVEFIANRLRNAGYAV